MMMCFFSCFVSCTMIILGHDYNGSVPLFIPYLSKNKFAISPMFTINTDVGYVHIAVIANVLHQSICATCSV